MMLLYDPNRVNFPMKRTNPQKGIGIDPKWVEISWDEALDTITERLRKIRTNDPRKLLAMSSVTLGDSLRMNNAFAAAFGSPNILLSGAGIHCGNGSHLFSGLMHCGWTKMPDPNYIKYYLNFGCPSGFGLYYSVTGMAERMANARKRGMKHVVIEPWMGAPGFNSDEWVPIRPGTDAALALSMVNLLLNDYGIYDIASIKQYTNGPYLVRANGYYMRDEKTKKPLVFDVVDSQLKTYDDTSIKDVALEGSYSFNGTIAKPAFALLKEHVKKYTPEMASEITTVPVETIRRLSKDFGEAARIGSTIMIEGKELPYRPVAVGFFKGAAAHKHSALTCMALELLQEIVGANNVPGGCLGMNSRSFGYPETGEPSYSPSEGPDGLVKVGLWNAPPPWPVQECRKPEMLGMNDLVPTAGASPLVPISMIEGEKYKIPYKAEFMMQVGANYMMTFVDPRVMEKAFKDNIFTVAFNIYLDESTEFADIVLPDASYLERLDLRVDWDSSISPVDEWSYHIRQPVVDPIFQRRPAQKVILELAERLGILSDMYRQMNVLFNFKEPYALDPSRKYTWEEIVDRRLRGYFGSEHGLEWFKRSGLIKWPKKAEEVYWRPFIKARVPIYFEHFKTIGEQVKRITEEYDIPDFETSDFQPLPDWRPCPSHQEKRSEYDLYGVYYRIPFQTFTFTYNNPWLDEASGMDPYTHNIVINTETARRKEIKDGDWLIIESAGTGHRIEGRARLTEAVHPEVIAYASGGGHWSKRLPVASRHGKGVCPEWLIPSTFDYIDMVSFNQDLCVKVKVTRKTKETQK
jgi:molybdopterin-containing oxidoreductase family molybdopterin binding subunit